MRKSWKAKTRGKWKVENDYEDSEDDELDDLLSHIDDDYDDESSVNNAEKGNSDKENDVSTKLI